MWRKEKGRESVYYGESSRTGFERGLEHVADIRSKDKESHIRRHLEEEHGGLENSENSHFSMKILRRHQSSFCRQIHEAVVISRNQHKNILNSKNEYNRCILPRLGVMMGEREERDEKSENGGASKTPGPKVFITEYEEEEVIGEGRYKRRMEKGNHGQPREK